MAANAVTAKSEISLNFLTPNPELVETIKKKVGEYVKNRAIFFGIDNCGEMNFLADSYPCCIEINGIRYQNATAAIEAQKLVKLNAVKGVLPSNQNKNRRSDFDQESATSFVYRLKFSQNPDLKNLLFATDDAYLVHIGPDQIWSDRFDCFGKNKYGCILMQIRGELGGKGPVKSPGNAFMLRDIREKQIGFEVFTLDQL